MILQYHDKKHTLKCFYYLNIENIFISNIYIFLLWNMLLQIKKFKECFLLIWIKKKNQYDKMMAHIQEKYIDLNT